MTAPRAAPQVPFSAALGGEAFGLRHLRAGFAFDDAGDAAFAVGSPHLAWLVDDRGDAATAAKVILETSQWPKAWPQGAAARVVRAWGVFATRLNGRGTMDLLPDGKKAIAAAADVAAATAIVTAQFTGPFPTAPDLPRLLFVAEALFGTEPVLEALTTGLEALPTDRLTSHEFQLREAARVAGFLLLRASSASSTQARARLLAVFQRGAGKKLARFDGATGAMSVVRGLDLALHDREGAERSGNRPTKAVEPRDLLLVHGAPAWVAAELERGGPPTKHHRPDARLAFLGGEAALRHQLEGWKKFPVALDVLEAFAEVKSELVVAMVLEMATAPKTKAAATEWFRRRWSFAEPLVRKAKSPVAAVVLAALGA